MSSSTLWKVFTLLLLVEVASYFSWHEPVLGVVCWVVIVAATFAISLSQPEIGVAVVLAELVLGGKGYLFSLPFGSMDISIRLGIFAAVFLASCMHIVQGRSLWGGQRAFRYAWLVLLGAAVWGVVVGLLRNHGAGAIFDDANAFLFLGLIPAFGLLKNQAQVRRLLYVAGVAVVVMMVKTFAVQALFDHIASTSLVPLYRWVRDTGVGEITYIVGHLYRVFFQSHIYGIFGFFLGVSMVIVEPVRRWWWMLVASAGAMVVITSLSRSFWLGAGVAVCMVGFGVLYNRIARKQFGKVLLWSGCAILLGYLGFVWSVNFPGLWGGGASGGSLVRQRAEISTESAVSSRKELLPVMNQAITAQPLLGNGFGTALTYRTKDPRVSKNPEGALYTTTAYELGYHGFAVQFGLVWTLGIVAALAWVLWRVVHLLRLTSEHRPLLVGVGASILALCVIHLTTPYLNHPLGLGLLLLCTTIFVVYDARYANR
ncbi:MAG: hypothetical protein WC786_00955 [Patescibacteria group bacterium]|jgi:hypothetical protein